MLARFIVICPNVGHALALGRIGIEGNDRNSLADRGIDGGSERISFDWGAGDRLAVLGKLASQDLLLLPVVGGIWPLPARIALQRGLLLIHTFSHRFPERGDS